MCVRRLLFRARVETTPGRYDNFLLRRFDIFFVARTIPSMVFISNFDR